MFCLEDFVAELHQIKWFCLSGTPTEKYCSASSVFEAYDGCNQQMLSVWEPNIYLLEKMAMEKIGDAQIDEIFATISLEIDAQLQTCWCTFLLRQDWADTQAGLDAEILDMVKRDIAWACVEKMLNLSGFFSRLFEIYQEGFFPCSWRGPYPKGCAIVL